MEQFYFREYIPPIQAKTFNLKAELFHFDDVKDLLDYLNLYKKDPDYHFEYYEEDGLYSILAIETDDNVDQKHKMLIGHTNYNVSHLFKYWKGNRIG